MRTIIGIPARGPLFDPNENLDDKVDAETEEDTADIYEKPYRILFDGITEALKLLKAEE